MNDITDKIKNLESIINKIKRSATNYPGVKLRISDKGNGQYYVWNKEKEHWDYISNRNLDMVKELAQRDYEKMVQREASRQKYALETYKKIYDPKYLENIYSRMHPLKKKLIKPYEIPEDDYVRKWLAAKYETNPREIITPYHTLNKELVRSKSEALIADMLKALGIPYRYECKLQLGKVTVYPDFTLLDKSTRREIIFEHFGMLDKSDYANNFVYKMKTYAQHGFVLGTNLIATFETSDNPIDISIVETAVTKCLEHAY